METLTETISSVIVVNDEPEFIADSQEKIDANTIILCEEKTFGGDRNIFEYEILGKSILSWVERVCDVTPIVLRISEDEDFLTLIKPYLKDKEYTVVLYANTPLISKSHLSDIFSFAKRKRLAVCKLKKGYIMSTAYAKSADEILSVDSYDVASNDFFEVNSPEDFVEVSEVLKSRLIAHHLGSGTEIACSVSLDADVLVGENSKILPGAVLSSGSTVGAEVVIGENAIIRNSKIGDGTAVGAGAIIQDSILKNNVKIEAGAVIKHSVVGDNSDVNVGASLVDSAIKSNVIVDSNACLDKVCVEDNAEIGKLSRLAGGKDALLIEAGRKVEAGKTIIL